MKTVQCVNIGETDIVTAEPQKLHLVRSGEGQEVVAGTNVLVHLNESGNTAMLEYTDQSQ
jgi:hypothetical protein